MAVDKTIKLKADTKDAVKGIEQVKQGVKGVDKSAKDAKSGLGGMTGAAKGLGVAFKALGIGLIISAFMKLKDIFSGNIETARRFERIAAQLSTAFDVIRDRAEEFIKSLIKLKNPFKAFKDAFTGTTKEIKEEVKAIDTLTIALQKIRDQERDLLTVRAEANKTIAESRLLAEDETKTREERLVALKAAIAEETRVADIEKQIQKDKVDALQAIIDLGKSSEEDMQNLAAEKARLTELETASILKQKRVVTEINTFEREIAAEKKREQQEELKRQKDLEDARKKELDDLIKYEAERAKLQAQTADSYQQVTDRNMSAREKEEEATREHFEKLRTASTDAFMAGQIDSQQAVDDAIALKKEETAALLEIEKKYSQASTKIDKLTADQKRGILATSMGQVSNLLGQESKAGKALAIGQALINTYVGATTALKQGGIFGAIAAAGVVASGMASVKQIKDTKLPGADGVSIPTPEPKISSIDTEIQEEGPTGIGALVPNIQALGSPTLGGVAPVQAYVVENDISNSQALQEELEVQATL